MLIFYYFITKTTKFSTSYIPSYIFISPPASMNTNADTQDNFSSSQSKSVWDISVFDSRNPIYNTFRNPWEYEIILNILKIILNHQEEKEGQ